MNEKMDFKNNLVEAKRAPLGLTVDDRPVNLLGFFKKEVHTRIQKRDPLSDIKILEVGTGLKSIFTEFTPLDAHITAIDINKTIIQKAKKNNTKRNIEYLVSDIRTWGHKNQYDLVMDAHLLHNLTNLDDRELYFKNAFNTLYSGGILALETMISHDKMRFTDFYEYNEINQTLYREQVLNQKLLEQKLRIPFRFIPRAEYIEEELINYGFKILYFKCERDLKFIMDPHRSIALPTDPEVLQIIAKKV